MADKEKPHLHVEFYTEPTENPAKSRAAGRPIFEDKEFVRIRIAGDRNRTHVAPADEKSLRDKGTNEWLTYKDRFPDHYAAFKKGQVYIGEGTPLSELPFLTQSKRAELRALNIHTAEVLAAMDGTPLKQLGMGGRELKNQAQAWLDNAAGSADATKQAAQIAAQQDQIAELQRQIAEMATQQMSSPALKAQTVTATSLGTTVTVPVGVGMSPFAAMNAEEIKAWLAEKTGARPRGNPSHQTLVNMAEDFARTTDQTVAA